jgi:DNA-directed RNA polymerase I, II, and III subunit RPABC2
MSDYEEDSDRESIYSKDNISVDDVLSDDEDEEKTVLNKKHVIEQEDEDEEINDDDEEENDFPEEEEDDEDEDHSKPKRGNHYIKGISGGAEIEKEALNDYDIDWDEEEEDEEDESYLQKFEYEINKDMIVKFHPESIVHNYEEVSKLTKVIRDSNNVIVDPLHKTLPYLTKYEKARILGQRAKQIEMGAKPFVSVPESVIEPSVIAELELQQKKIPFIIRRPLPNGSSEYWNLKDLEIIG